MTFLKKQWISLLVPVLLILSGVTAGTKSELPALISRDDLFAPEKYSGAPLLSPDGKKLAYFAVNSEGHGIFLRMMDEESPKLIMGDLQMRTSLYRWAYDNRHLICLADPDGKENCGLFTIDTQDPNPVLKTVAFIMGTQVLPVKLSKLFPNEMLVAINYTSAGIHDVYRVNLQTGARVMVFKNPGQFVEFYGTDSLKILAGRTCREDGSGAILVRMDTLSPWRQMVEFKPNETATAEVFSADEKWLYLTHNLEGEYQSLYRCRLSDLSTEKVFTPPEGELGNVWFSRPSGLPAMAECEHLRTRLYALDTSYAPDLKTLSEKQPASSFRILGRDTRDSIWTVCYWTSASAPNYYMYSRKSRILFFLFSAQPHLARLPLVQSGDVDFLARDGMHLYGYLTLPAGIPAHNLPLVVSVHGGPALRDSWGYSGETQWLANRGYAVLEVNFRGSVGFGKSYFTAGFSQWGTTMIADIVDGARWAVKSGIADSSRLGIMGWSFGGYASIAAAAFYPDVFRCAVDICGPTDLVSLMKDAPPYWNKLYGFLKHYLGDWEKEPEKVKSMSPLNSAARISIPILIAHGEQDPRVDVHEARRFVEALTLANKNVSYFEFPSEGHAFVYQRSQRMLHGVIEGFLKQNLGGRCKELSWSEKGYAELVKKQTQQAMIGR